MGRLVTSGTRLWEYSDPQVAYPYGAVERFSGINNVTSYADKIGYQLILADGVSGTGFQSLLNLRLSLKEKELYCQLGLPSVVAASETLRRVTNQAPRNVFPYQDYPYEEALATLDIAIPDPDSEIPDALRAFLGDVPPYKASYSFIGPPNFRQLEPARMVTAASRIVRELIETDLLDDTIQLLVGASFGHQTQAWRPVFRPESVLLTWIPGAAKDGQQLLRVATPNGSVAQDVVKPVMPSESYSLQVWLRTSPGTQSPQNVTLTLWGLGGNQENGVTTASVGDTWTLVTVGLDAQYAHDTLRAELYVNNSIDMSGARVIGIP